MSVEDQGRKVLGALEAMRGMAPDDAAKWLEAHNREFDDNTLAAIFQQSEELSKAHRQSNPDAWERIQAIAARGGLAGGGEPLKGDKLAAQAIADAKLGAPLNEDLDRSGTVTPGEHALVSTAVQGEAKQIEQAAKSTGASQETAKATADKATKDLTSTTTPGVFDGLAGGAPDWLVNNLTGGSQPSPGQEAALVVTWNRYHPESPVTNVGQLYGRMKNAQGAGEAINLSDPKIQSILESAVLGSEPLVETSVPMPGGKSIKIDQATYKNVLDNLGMQPSDVATYVRLASRAHLYDASGQPNWQVLAMIERSRGPEAKPGATPGPRDIQEESKAQSRPPAPAKGTGPWSTRLNEAQGSLNDRTTRGFQDALKFQEGLRRYDSNDELALVYTLDPALAARLAAAPAAKWSGEDRHRLSQIEVSAGFSKQSLGALGQGGTDLSDYLDPETKAKQAQADAKKAQADKLDQAALDKAAYMNDLNKDGIPDYKQRPKLDQAKVRQAAKDLFQSLFLSDPTDAELANLVGAANGAQSRSNGFDDSDPQAALEASARGSSNYKSLYGAKPGGMSEQEYQAQFKSGVQDILGAQANPDAVKAGMRSGQFNTAVGAAAHSPGVFDNSTFMGRLAGAAQVFGEFT